MPLYLTPDRYRVIGSGVDLSSKTDTQLLAALTSASETVNQAVNAPRGYSFLGGSVEDEEHQWKVNTRYVKATDGRIWPFMRPVRSVSGMTINVTKEQYVSFTDEQLFVQSDLGYVEPVAAPDSMALFTSIPPWLLTSPVAKISYEYGFDMTATDELLAQESGGVLRAGHQFWYTDEDVVLKEDGVVVASGYTVDYEEGTITYGSADESKVYRASYHHKLPPGIAAATALVATDIFGASAIAAAGMVGLSGIKVEEVELRQSSKVNYYVTPVNAAAKMYLSPYMAMFTSMR